MCSSSVCIVSATHACYRNASAWVRPAARLQYVTFVAVALRLTYPRVCAHFHGPPQNVLQLLASIQMSVSCILNQIRVINSIKFSNYVVGVVNMKGA